MLSLQDYSVSLFTQLREFGLNPEDWYMNIRWSENAIELTHQEDSEIKLLGSLFGNKSFFKVHSLSLLI